MAAVVFSIEGDRLRVPASALTHEGFRAWVISSEFPEGIRATFVAQEVLFEMSPEALNTHNQVKGAVTAGLTTVIERDDLGVRYPDGALVTNTEAALSTEPDFTFVAWASFEAGRVRLVPKKAGTEDHIEIQGTPDLVVEIVSDTSVRKDTKLLTDAYRRASIPEYWLIDARGAEIAFTILRRQGHAYVPSGPPGSTQASAVLGRSFELRRRKNRIGSWSYRLVEADV